MLQGVSRTVGNAAGVVQFLVSGVSGDYLVCKTLSGTSSGSDYVYVAKPYLLRRSVYSGATRNGVTYTGATGQTRNASTGGTAVSEQVTPSYQTGDIVYGIGPVVGEIGTLGMIFVDLNIDGRAFAQVDA